MVDETLTTGHDREFVLGIVGVSPLQKATDFDWSWSG